MALTVNIDGGSRGNPGPAGAGVVIRDDDAGLVFEAGFFLGDQTNNVAEYEGLLRGLQRVAESSPTDVCIISDSELLVKQITGEYRVKNARLQELYESAQLLLLRLPRWRIQHVKRRLNARADELANLAMDAKRDVVVFDVDAGIDESAAYDNHASAVSTTDDAAKQPTEAPVSSPAIANGVAASGKSRPRLVRISFISSPRDDDACPAGYEEADTLMIGETLPPGMCLHAASALLPTLLAIQNADPQDIHEMPEMTVRCSNPSCAAAIRVAVQRGDNGRHA